VCGRGAGPGHCGHFAQRPETVEVLGVRAQTAGDRVHAMRVGLPGQLHTGRHQRGERLGRGHLPLDGDVGVRQAAVPVGGQQVRASRVHSNTLVESGSPEATPRWNGYLPPVRARGRGADTAAAATARPPSTIVRRRRSPITCTVRPAPEQRSRMRDDHAGKLVHPELIRTWASCRRTSAPNRVT
jgi:hypothetical protein